MVATNALYVEEYGGLGRGHFFVGARGAAGFRMGSLLLGWGCAFTGSTQNPDYQVILSSWVLGLKALCWSCG